MSEDLEPKIVALEARVITLTNYLNSLNREIDRLRDDVSALAMERRR